MGGRLTRGEGTDMPAHEAGVTTAGFSSENGRVQKTVTSGF